MHIGSEDYGMLTNPYLIALGIPIMLILCGAVARKLVRGARWQCSDFFLGVELSLAAMASAMVHIFDLAKLISSQSGIEVDLTNKFATTASFLVICFFFLLWILSTHQDWEKRSQNPTGQLIWLGIIANITGIGLWAGFVFLVKGI